MNSWATRVAYFTIAVKDLDAAAKKLAQAGFTLKRPHHYTNGHQRGLIAQAIKLKNGQKKE